MAIQFGEYNREKAGGGKAPRFRKAIFVAFAVDVN
jgi:hypothetical protein